MIYRMMNNNYLRTDTKKSLIYNDWNIEWLLSKLTIDIFTQQRKKIQILK